MGVSLKNIRKAIWMRQESDPQMSSAWLLLYILPSIVSIVAVGYALISLLNFAYTIDPLAPTYTYDEFPWGFVLSVIALGLSGLISFVMLILLTYMLVKRRTTHFMRQKFLSDDLLVTLVSLAKTKGVEVEAVLFPIEGTVREANAEETEKEEILWAILSAIIPFAQWYVYYFLMTDFYTHERREDRFWEDLGRALNKLGINFSVPQRTGAMPERSFVLYLILTVVTMGLFGVYWIYVLLKDPNDHFNYHVQAESQLLAALESVAI